MALAVASMLCAIAPAAAIDIADPAQRNALILQGRANEILNLENRQRRLQYQQQQQFYSQQDRAVQPLPPRALKVPRFRSNCQTQVFGADFLKTCR